MKILLIADEESSALWDFYDPARTEGVDLIISCGDLKPEYLEFLVTMVNCPLLYVRGNHDGKYDRHPPTGCVPIDDRIYDFKGLRILGLGGSMRYHPGGGMYTEQEMRRRVSRITPRITFMNGFDILVTHAPAKGYGDLEDLPHQGFAVFNELLEKWRPRYMCYGHVHKSYGDFQREMEHASGAHLINAWKSHELIVGEDEFPMHGRTGSPLYDLYISMQKRTGRSRIY